MERGVVTLRATELDVLVRGKKVGTLYDCGDCWRVTLSGRLRRRGMNLPDFDSRAAALRGVLGAVVDAKDRR